MVVDPTVRLVTVALTSNAYRERSHSVWTLARKGPAQSPASAKDAQPHRPLIQQARPHLYYDQKNEFNMG